jgi:hypothetical protein
VQVVIRQRSGDVTDEDISMAAAPSPPSGKFLEVSEDAITLRDAPICPESGSGPTVLLLTEIGRRVEGMTCALQIAATASQNARPERTRQIVVETAAQLRSVKLLLEHVDDWFLDDPRDLVAEQVRRVRDLCAAADAAFELAARAFAASRATMVP